MTDSQSSDASSQNSKKGLSPLAWLGIGCGGVAVLALIALVVGGMFVTSKVKEGLANANGNPERFAAEMIVKLNPEMEMVETNDGEGTMTIKMTKTGEVHSLSYADVAEGKFSMQSTTANGKTTTIKHDGKTIKIEDGDGKTTVITAAKKGDYWANLPAGLKDFAYPNVSEVVSPLATVEDDKAIKISFMFITKDSQAKVLEFYQEKLKAGNFTIEDESGLMGKDLEGSKDKQLVRITLLEQGKDSAVMFYTELSK